ncbi:acetate--CoA ligase family protein [Pararhizobium sp. YC-54]|uniref:acetate--CoA ligase family protein n=1 Tax=Pararhizobium sp. YC-54 TaxID=2986920 RepID=UPI0021F7AC97|nr:acetate--CoA ligase family protein [Pararhizobium sp. YC-54]MCW0001753.1 acetate--CoA ligase family protein [Pararhizobium sp. YC-54]
MPHKLEPLFHPQAVVFIGGSNLNPALKYHRDLGFAGDTWIVNPKYSDLEGYPCFPSVESLPYAPDLAFVAIRREAAIDVIAELRRKGCRAVVCNAAGFAETGSEGSDLQAKLLAASGDMALLGPNSVGLVNFINPMAAMMDHFGVHTVDKGVAIVSQGGGLLCDAVFSDRGLAITHMVGAGNQAVTGLESCVDYLLDCDRVTAVGLSFEAIHNVPGLRKAAAKALRLGKPIVAIKFGKTEAGAQAAASHTASMTGAGAAWEALFDRLGIISTNSESEFFETLKLIDAGAIPKGRRALVTAVSGVMGVMLADHLSAAGFELPQPTGERVIKLREVLPVMATPGNPQDVTMGAWNDLARQTAIYSALLEEGYDVALMVQNYPREGMWDITEYEAQVEALGAACDGRDVARLQLAPMVDCFPAHARQHTQSLGLAAMQGLEECMKALSHGVWWRERRDALISDGLDRLADVTPIAPANRVHLDEATAKSLLASAGVAVPTSIVTSPEKAHEAAENIGFPVVVKALDARLLHKTEVGAVRLGLTSLEAVSDAIKQMRDDMHRLAPDIPLRSVLVESMTRDVVAEVMVSISVDPSVGPVMMLAGGGIEAELWNDSTLIAAPFTRPEIERALERLKVTARIKGWRGRPAGDRVALLDSLEALAQFALANEVEEIEINPILVGRSGAVAVDAVLKISEQQRSVA